MSNKWASIAEGVSPKDPFYNNNLLPLALGVAELVDCSFFIEIRAKANRIRDIDIEELFLVSNFMRSLS